MLSRLKIIRSSLESVLFGSAGLLDKSYPNDRYWNQLNKSYIFLKKKFQLSDRLVETPYFFRLRPSSFPTIRLSQFASLYSSNSRLFSKIITFRSKKDLFKLFAISPSDYWKTHYVFGKASGMSREHLLSTNFIELLIINSIIPLLVCYNKWQAKPNTHEIIDMVKGLKAEKNKITRSFRCYGVKSKNALMSQAIIHLYNNYCIKHRCLDCAIGISLLKVK